MFHDDPDPDADDDSIGRFQGTIDPNPNSDPGSNPTPPLTSEATLDKDDAELEEVKRNALQMARLALSDPSVDAETKQQVREMLESLQEQV